MVIDEWVGVRNGICRFTGVLGALGGVSSIKMNPFGSLFDIF